MGLPLSQITLDVINFFSFNLFSRVKNIDFFLFSPDKTDNGFFVTRVGEISIQMK
jgi:hypothetical protein